MCERACAYVFDADNLLDSYVVLVNPVSRDQRMKKTEQRQSQPGTRNIGRQIIGLNITIRESLNMYVPKYRTTINRYDGGQRTQIFSFRMEYESLECNECTPQP